MLFTSPAFLFLFLPLMLGLYFVTPQRLRRYAVSVFSIAFYVLANHGRPASVIFLLMTAAFTYCAAFAVYSVPKRGTVFFAVSIPVLALVSLRMLAMTFSPEVGRLLPLGASFFLLSSISTVVDVSRGDAPPPRSFFDILLYITYFPVLIAGPVIKYKDFLRLGAAPDAFSCSLANVSGGIRLFVLGFIKRVAIAEVLNEAYRRIADQIGNGTGPVLGLLVAAALGVLLLVSVFYTFEGYSEMGRGLSLMLGLRLECDFGSCLDAYCVTGYAENFMASLLGWFSDYIVLPLERLGRRGRSFWTYVAAPAAALCMMLWFRAGATVLVAMVPVVLLAMADRRLGLRRILSRNLATRTLGRLLTWGYMAFFWLLIRTQDVRALVSALRGLTVGEPRQSYTLILTVFNREILGVVLLILFVRLPVILGQLSRLMPKLGAIRTSRIPEAVWTMLVLAVFFAAVAFVLPQYPDLAVMPFRGMTL